jgi:peptidylprolyl isomerase/FKBP-type peptidyl-prolyl cis-trans isomerase FklB
MRTLAVLAAAALLAACGQQSASELAAQDPENAEASPAAQKNLADGKAFLANNAKVEGVKTLPSGVQYKVVRSGPEGGVSPTPQDEVKIHYEGKLLDGSVFDSSYERGVPSSFVLGNLIPGWVEALQQMKPGDEWILWIPPEQAYGPQDKGPIPGNSVLIFRIELFDVLGGGPARV